MEPGQQGRTTPLIAGRVTRLFTTTTQESEGRMTTEISTNTTPARGLALATFDDAFRFAKVVASTEFAPKDFRGKPEACMLAIQAGSEVGLSPMQSLQSIAVINGRPSIWGDAAMALVQASPVCEFVREYTEGDGDNLVAVCEAKRRGYPAPTVVRFSVADAKKAGLWGKSGPWQQYPARMLALRARGFALRNAFADALRGLITAEEAQDYPQATPTQPPREPVVVRAGYAARAAEDGEIVAERRIETPDEPARATSEDMVRARHAVQLAKTDKKLREIRSKVEKRLLDEAFYSDGQADELFALIDGKLELLTGEEVTS